MLEIKQIKEIDGELNQKIEDFFKKSKPSEFCQLKMPSLRTTKIREYLQHIYKCSHIYVAYENKKFVGMCFFKSENDHIYLEFLFGDFSLGSVKLINSFHSVLEEISKECNIYQIKAEIRRKHKVNAFLKWIKRYDKKCKIIKGDLTTIIWQVNEW
jgi:hypothetical protein